MKKLVVYLFVATQLLISCKLNTEESGKQKVAQLKLEMNGKVIHNVSVADFQKAMQLPNASLLDIRTSKEYQQGHIDGAINIDWYQRSFKSNVLHIPKDKPILIYCRSGNRSGKTSGVLQSLGYLEIYNLEKGIKQWILEKAPVTQIDSKINTDFQNKIQNTKTKTVTKTNNSGKIFNLSAIDFKKAVQLKKAAIIDIRTPQEFASGHLKAAVNINWYQRSFKDLIQDIPKDKPIAIYCHSGNRSGKATNLLQSLGFQEIIHLEHGIIEWNKHNFPLE